MTELLAHARRSPEARWIVLLLGACALVGLLSGIDPTYGIAAALGLAFTAIVLGSTWIGVVLFTLFSFLEVLQTGGPGGSFIKVAGLLLFASWLASASTERRRSAATLLETSPLLVAGAVGLVAWAAISTTWAESTSSAIQGTYRFLLDLLLIPIVFGTIRRRREVTWMVIAFVAGAVFSALYGFAVPSSATGFDAGRSTGTLGDANDQAAVLVAAIALEFALIGITRHRPQLRALAILAMTISVVGVFYTLSRSGLLALGGMMVAGVVFGGRWRRWAGLALAIAAFALVGYLLVIAPLSARQRVTSADTSGRSTIWTVGWRMVEANPLNGVGADNFLAASIHYLQKPGGVTRADLIVDTPKVAHNVYLELLADLGIPGLLALLAILGGALTASFRAAALFERRGQRDLELISRCVGLGLVGFMISDFFLSGEYSKQLWLLIALGPTLLALARRETPRGDEPQVRDRLSRPLPTVLAGTGVEA